MQQKNLQNLRMSMVCAGKALAVALASKGVHVTILDLNTDLGEETARLVGEEHAKISYKSSAPSAIVIRCDVSKSGKCEDNSKIPLCLTSEFSVNPREWYLDACYTMIQMS